MKVMVVAKYGRHGFAPFVQEQVDALRQQGVDVTTFAVKGRGIGGYLHNIKPLKKALQAVAPDLMHAHYGLCGLLCNMQRGVPVITTYHGSDINDWHIRQLSKISIWFSVANIFVSDALLHMVRYRRRAYVQPCGVDTTLFYPIDKTEARKRLGLDSKHHIVLFASSYTNAVKSPNLAKEAVAGLNDSNVCLIELNNYSRAEVALLLNAADVLLLTSKHEGSPQVVKEAMAVGCPIVSVDVGDVRKQIADTGNNYVSATRSSTELTSLLRKVLKNNQRSNGREKLIKNGLTNEAVAQSLCRIFQQAINDNIQH
ncbi:MAG: glycosyltransferase [Bacteroidales bacterium]|nr:glycosyltransferase [Bacteroidales bacterium]MBR1799448.1 glycosyltransferase [Bacteroidales bacterium]